MATKRTPSTRDEIDRDLQDDFAFGQDDARHAEHSRRLNQHDERFRKLEARVNETGEALGDHLVGHGARFPARDAKDDEQEGVDLLAKASQAFRTYTTPEGLLRKADEVLTSADEIGRVQGYISANDLEAAAEIVAKAESIAAKRANEEPQVPMNPLDRQIAEHDLRREIAKIKEVLEALGERLAQVEARPPTRRPAPKTDQREQEALGRVAKAAGVLARATQAVSPRDDAAGLLTRADGVLSSPSQMGLVSSLVQRGDLNAAREFIERAELRHEAEKTKRERRTL